MRICSALHCQPNGNLVVGVGGLDSWGPRMKGIVMKGVPPFESRPQTTSLPLVDMDSKKNNNSRCSMGLAYLPT